MERLKNRLQCCLLLMVAKVEAEALALELPISGPAGGAGG